MKKILSLGLVMVMATSVIAGCQGSNAMGKDENKEVAVTLEAKNSGDVSFDVEDVNSFDQGDQFGVEDISTCMVFYTKDDLTFEKYKSQFKEDLSKNQIKEIKEILKKARELAEKQELKQKEATEIWNKLYSMDVFEELEGDSRGVIENPKMTVVPSLTGDDNDASVMVENTNPSNSQEEKKLTAFEYFAMSLKEGLSKSQMDEIKALYEKAITLDKEVYDMQEAIGKIMDKIYVMDVFDNEEINLKENDNEKSVKMAITELGNVVGVIVEVGKDGGSILVESTSKAIPGLIWLSITEKTVVPKGKELKVGSEVKIFVEGAIAESYPMQAEATIIHSITDK